MLLNQSDHRDRRAWDGVLAGVAGGLAGAWAMNQFQTALSSWRSQQQSGAVIGS